MPSQKWSFFKIPVAESSFNNSEEVLKRMDRAVKTVSVGRSEYWKIVSVG